MFGAWQAGAWSVLARQFQPDLIVVDAESQGRDILEHVVLATRDERRPSGD